MGNGLRKTLAAKFDDELRFFKGWIDRPRAVGSIVPTGSVTARRMASVIDTGSGLPVLEVGPGTGVITRAILARGVKPENLYAVEYSPEFVRHLRRLYPAVNVIEGDAFNALKVKRSRDRIQSLGFFQENLEIKQTQGSAPDRVILGLDVEEKSTGELQLSAGYSSLEAFLVSLSVRQRNFRGLGQELRASVSVAARSKLSTSVASAT